MILHCTGLASGKGEVSFRRKLHVPIECKDKLKIIQQQKTPFDAMTDKTERVV